METCGFVTDTLSLGDTKFMVKRLQVTCANHALGCMVIQIRCLPLQCIILVHIKETTEQVPVQYDKYTGFQI